MTLYRLNNLEYNYRLNNCDVIIYPEIEDTCSNTGSEHWPIQSFSSYEDVNCYLNLRIDHEIPISRDSKMYICRLEYKFKDHICIFFVGCTTDINTTRVYNNIISNLLTLDQENLFNCIISKLIK